MTAVTSVKVSTQVDMPCSGNRKPVQQWRLTAEAVQANCIGALSRWAHLQLLKRVAID